MLNIVCFGEVLWDEFPEQKKIGGAPLNVALRLQSFNNNTAVISRIGADENGEKIVAYCKDKGVQVDNIQVDETLNTGIVKVILNEKGSASYNIKFPSAWDNIHFTDSTKKFTESSDAFVYGSLVARNDASRNTLYELLKVARYKVFDINLRTPYYTPSILNHLMMAANFIKFNDDEIFEVAKEMRSKSHSLEQNILFVAEQTNTSSICVTKGPNGAVLYYNNTFYYNSGYKINVVDTVGAGDSFLASLIDKLLNGVSPQEAINFACAVGALVASAEGANPEISVEEIEAFY